MKKKLSVLFASFLTVAITASAFLSAPVSANVLDEACTSNPDSALCTEGQTTSVDTVIDTIVNVLFLLVGLLAVIMIIVSGIRFVTSSGNSGAVESAKKTLLYSVIGLIVALLAYAIVNFVLDTFL